MGVHYATSVGGQWPYPVANDIATDYDQTVGEGALLFATVERVYESNESARVRVSYSNGTFPMLVDGFTANVDPGGTVQVFGELQPGHSIATKNVVVVNRASDSKLYKYGVSIVGALLILVLFFRYWRVNVSELCFEVRNDG
jgi:hypothetical protein